MLRPRLRHIVVVAFAAAVLTPLTVRAQWIPNGTPVCIQPGDQELTGVVSDGTGGMLMTWADRRTGVEDIYAQRITATGSVSPGWPSNGLALCTAPGVQSAASLATDGAGGAFVAWQDLRGGGTYDIFMQHVTGAGVVDPAWPVNGIALCTASSDQISPALCSDGAGGVIVTWQDLRSGNNDIFAARVDGTGALLPGWSVNGNPVCAAAGDQNSPKIVPDGANGAIITWVDARSGSPDIYALRMLSDGTVAPGWAPNGTTLCNATNFQNEAQICADGVGGAYVAWRDNRTGTTDIYATHLNASGGIVPGWVFNGSAVCAAPGFQQGAVLCLDGGGGTIITWEDYRHGNGDIFAQRLNSDGSIATGWRVDGNPVVTESHDQIVPGIVADGLGGAFIGWCDLRTSGVTGIDLYSTEITANGVPAPGLPPDGFPNVIQPGNQVVPELCLSSPGVALLGWHDRRTGDYDIYAQLLPVNVIVSESPGVCLSSPAICTTVPVDIKRHDARNIRGYSVTFSVSSNLVLCSGVSSITEGDYLISVNSTFYQVTDNGGGSYTVDCFILGDPCGATAQTGNLFNLAVKRTAGPDGVGTVTITDLALALRDCDNHQIAVVAGAPAKLGLVSTPPSALSDLAATQVKSGNDADGTTRIQLSWSAVPSGSVVEVYRARFGNYPSYDDSPNPGSVPIIPSYPPPARWQLAGVANPGETDEISTRDFLYYVAFVRDPCNNLSAVSNMTSGTLNYFLGDVHNNVTNCAGNNLVNTSDVSFFGAHYGIDVNPGSPYACLDVGPTTDLSVNGRPTTDNTLDFEDLMMFSLNFGAVSAPQARAVPASEAAHRDLLAIDAPTEVAAGEIFSVRLMLHGDGDLQGLSARLSWNPARVAPISVTSGGMIESQGGVMMSPGPGAADVALLGVHERGMLGDGTLATVSFRALGSGDPEIALAAVKARDASNHPVAIHLGGALPGADPGPLSTELEPASPNPFHDLSTLAFSLAQRGLVELAIFSVDGRRVRTLARDTRGPGRFRLEWDGRDDRGGTARPGVYFARLRTPAQRFTRTIIFAR